MNSMGQRLKQYRIDKGFTQEYVAAQLGIRTSNYAKYESGERVPKDERLLGLAKILEVSYMNLVYGEEYLFMSLLYQHLKGAITGDVNGFDSYLSDIEGNIYEIIQDCFEKWSYVFRLKAKAFFERYLESPELSMLIELNECYKKAQENDSIPCEHCQLNEEFEQNLGYAASYKLAFCISATKYLNTFSTEDIFDDVRDYYENEDLRDDDALAYFTIKVFGPYLAHITDALDDMVSNDDRLDVDAFEVEFLFDAVNPANDEWYEEIYDEGGEWMNDRYAHLNNMLFYEGSYETALENDELEIWEQSYENCISFTNVLGDIVKNHLSEYTLDSLIKEFRQTFKLAIPVYVLSYNICRLELVNSKLYEKLIQSYGQELFDYIDKKAFKGSKFEAKDITFINDTSMEKAKNAESLEDIQLVTFTLELIVRLSKYCG